MSAKYLTYQCSFSSPRWVSLAVNTRRQKCITQIHQLTTAMDSVNGRECLLWTHANMYQSGCVFLSPQITEILSPAPLYVEQGGFVCVFAISMRNFDWSYLSRFFFNVIYVSSQRCKLWSMFSGKGRDVI